MRLLTPFMMAISLMATPVLAKPWSFSDASQVLTQDPLAPPWGLGHIQAALDRLNVVGTILYVAAHPDDENTRLLAYLAGERGLRTAYVSLTRGDGGQNLIGSELGPLLGLIRTYELMAARRIDGAEQYFTRALDFGFSKSARESLAKWGIPQTLAPGEQAPSDTPEADLVRLVRTIQPDVMMARFSEQPPNHGHHMASAFLASRVFDLAADQTQFTEHFTEGLKPHAVTRLFENVSTFRPRPDLDLSKLPMLQVGTYSHALGQGYTALAAASRTMHKSQGFGSATAHGPQEEHFLMLKQRDQVALQRDPLAGLDFSWSRFPEAKGVSKALAAAQKAYHPRHPERLVKALVKVYAELSTLPKTGLIGTYRAQKLKETEQLILACAGLWVDARSATSAVVRGETLELQLRGLHRSTLPVSIRPKAVVVRTEKGLRELPIQGDGAASLQAGALFQHSHTLTIAQDQAYSTPFWLRAPTHKDRFQGEAASLIHARGPEDVAVRWEITIDGYPLSLQSPVLYAWVDPVHGERFSELEVLPALTVSPEADVLMLPEGQSKTLSLRVHAKSAPQQGRVNLKVPEGWQVKGEGSFQFSKAGDSQVLRFEVKAPKGAKATELQVELSVQQQTEPAWSASRVDYPHLPPTTVLRAAHVKAVPIELALGPKRIGYIEGAGDEVAASLASVGYEVTVLPVSTLEKADLSRFDALVAGIRAYNVAPQLAALHPKLMDFVAKGGTYVVQYQVSSRVSPLKDMPIGPHPFTISRERVTEEDSPLGWLQAKHPARSKPNLLTAEDEAGWVQERGLYFAEGWESHYEPLFAMADEGESPHKGSTIFTRHGKGVFVYTGLSFFRQLPAGVPGAYRLFANLLALGAAFR